MAMIVWQGVSGNIIAFLLVSVKGAQLSLNQVSFPAQVATVSEVDLCSICFMEPNNFTVSQTN